MSSSSPPCRAIPGRKDPAWKYTEPFPRQKRGEAKCKFCKTIFHGGINRLKYHLAGIRGHDAEPCTLALPEAIRECQVLLDTFETQKEIKNRQREELAQTSIGCVGEASFMPPYCPSGSASASVAGSASASGSTSATPIIGPRVRKSRMDSYFEPRITSGAQPSLERTAWNKEVHNKAKGAIGRFWFYCNIPFFAARSPSWQSMVDAIAICGSGFKAPSDSELSGPILIESVADVKATLEDQREIWKKKGCTIMIDGWTDRRNWTLLNFLVSSTGGTMFLKSIDASAHSKNATYLCEVIEEVIYEVGEENVVEVVTDNAANYVAVGKLLMERHPSIFRSPCAAHCIDLMLEDIGKIAWIKTCVEKAKNICKYVYNMHGSLT
ncbi:uncharacterized protein LOC131070430 [Cryptomeria japonica]|uniref:uncharacterized protein LOC131070430 n=1 Tax=Cryptomeria japonica TaxID=3369 RepID=UPI0025ACF0FD|nr:uncharacterized protein LOC131070430 [Cryptomeria japonica]